MVLDPLELELQEIVSCLIWGLGTKLKSFATIVTAFNCRKVFLSLCHIFKNYFIFKIIYVCDCVWIYAQVYTLAPCTKLSHVSADMTH